jgi:hypothetical protein
MVIKPRLISTLRVRGAVIIPAMRKVLFASMALAVIAMLWVYLGAPDAAPSNAPAVSGAR